MIGPELTAYDLSLGPPESLFENTQVLRFSQS